MKQRWKKQRLREKRLRFESCQVVLCSGLAVLDDENQARRYVSRQEVSVTKDYVVVSTYQALQQKDFNDIANQLCKYE